MSVASIQVEGLSKLYRIGLKDQLHDTLGGALISLLRAPGRNYRRLRNLTRVDREDAASEDVIWALREISLRVEQGEVLGIIGANGAGKTTLLKILAGITEPSEGRALVRGRIGSLLEVGTGFHPELTGRENVFLNGTILGMTRREIEAKFDEIVDFSGVERFIDTPVKRYSSGMRVRLAFAVAAHLEPEILLIDEVLAVGDAEFQKKCIGKMGEVAERGRTVLFVSHNMTAVKTLCRSVCWLRDGRVERLGAPLEVVTSYLEGGLAEETQRVWSPEAAPGNSEIVLLSARVVPSSGDRVLMGDAFELRFVIDCRRDLPYGLDLTFHLVDEMGTLVFAASTVRDSESWRVDQGIHEITARVPAQLINEGVYTISRLLFVKDKGTRIFEEKSVLRFEVLNPGEGRLGWISGTKKGVVRPRLAWRMTTLPRPEEGSDISG